MNDALPVWGQSELWTIPPTFKHRLSSRAHALEGTPSLTDRD